MKTSGAGSSHEIPNCTYSRIKAEKQTKAHEDELNVENNENPDETQQMVDIFIQDVIQKAKTEYFRQCENCNDNADSKTRDKGTKRRKDKENGKAPAVKSGKKSNKEKPKHRHHYKYSDPVDEKEISEYEQQDSESLLQWNPNFGAVASDSDTSSRNGFYNRMVSSVRRLLGCCFGKT